jgi:hypothetical protein
MSTRVWRGFWREGRRRLSVHAAAVNLSSSTPVVSSAIGCQNHIFDESQLLTAMPMRHQGRAPPVFKYRSIYTYLSLIAHKVARLPTPS